MQYNTTRTPVQMLEYGRGIQEMAAYLLTITDPETCRKQADVVIDAMAALHPSVKALEDYRQKLWDQLHLMTDGALTCECPYPKPAPPDVLAVPERPAYPQNKMRHRQFGKRFDELLKRALAETDPQKQQAFTQALGYYMKLAYSTWHREQPSDEAVRSELERLSDGLLKYEPGGVHVPFMPLTAKGQQSGNRLSSKPVQAPGSGRSSFRPAGSGTGGSVPQKNAAYGNSTGSSRGRKFFKHRNSK